MTLPLDVRSELHAREILLFTQVGRSVKTFLYNAGIIMHNIGYQTAIEWLSK